MIGADRRPGIRHGTDDGGTGVGEHLAGLGEHQVPALLPGQRNLDVALQQGQLLGHGGGRDHECLGHCLHTAQGSELAEDFQLVNFHPPSLCISQSFIVD